MKLMKTLVAIVIGLLVATAGHTAIVDNSGPPLRKPELTDAQKEAQMTGPNFLSGGDVPNAPHKSAPGISSNDDHKSALLDALGGKNADRNAEAALKLASRDVRGASSGWLVKAFLGALFAILGFGVVLALRRWSDRVFPPPGAPMRRSRGRN
ncbi:MAG: hypothetical protein C4340_00255 [Armatimonadota bacterium]